MKTKAEREKTGKCSVFFCVLYGFFAVVTLALLELNRNRVIGWIVAAALLAEYVLLRKRLQSRLARFGVFFCLLVLLCANLLITVGPVKLHPAVEGKTGGVTDVVSIADGKLTGVLTADRVVEVYAGIPYAAPPVGELRWTEPQPPEPWEGILKADTFAPMSMQPQDSAIYSSLAQIIGYHDYRISLKDNFREPNSEDALYLNIWKPAGEQEGLPVLVYIHGGSLQTGQPWYAAYSGEGLARKGVIVVNMGYRLGVFGFLATEELLEESPNGTAGNYGLLDQIMALRWVKENIAAFGGDPENITLAGESAGSACVSALCTSPLTKGLFRKAIGESSTTTAPEPAHSFRRQEEALKAGEDILNRFGAANIEELRQVDAEKLAVAADTIHHMNVDGYVLEMTPYEAYAAGKHNEEVILHGFNSEEGGPFLLFNQANSKNYEQRVRGYFGEYADEVLALYPPGTDTEAREHWMDIYSVVFFAYGHHCWARQAVAAGIPSYEYYFSKSNGSLGAWHSGEEIYCYNNIPEKSRLYDATDRNLAELFSDYFVNFLYSGDPNGEGLPRWEQSSAGTELMELGESQEMREDPYQSLYPIFDRMAGWENSEPPDRKS